MASATIHAGAEDRAMAPSSISRGSIAVRFIARYLVAVKRTTAIFAVLLLTACPLRPKDEETDSGADDSTTSEAKGESPASEPIEPGGTETGGAATCEDELAKVKAALAACQATSG
jgi:hypothetical protein